MIGDVPMRRFESRIRDRAVIAAILEMIPIVHVGIRDGDGWPYVVPMSFGYELREDRLLVYLHCAREGKLPRRYDIAFYNQLSDRSGAVHHLGDDILGERGREQVAVRLDRLPDWCGEVVLLLSVHRAEERRQHLALLDGLLFTAEGRVPGERLIFAINTGAWAGKGMAVAARFLRQPAGDWRLTAVFPDCHLPEWRE